MQVFIVKYNQGRYEDCTEITIFATFDKDKAEKYVDRFNGILNKWIKYYSDNRRFTEIYDSLTYTSQCYIEEVEIR